MSTRMPLKWTKAAGGQLFDRKIDDGNSWMIWYNNWYISWYMVYIYAFQLVLVALVACRSCRRRFSLARKGTFGESTFCFWPVAAAAGVFVFSPKGAPEIF